MNISAIRIKNFKKFDSRQFEFKNGINVIVGENEAGKTSLMDAIISALYIDPTTRSRTLLDTLLPWRGTKNMVLELDIENGDKKYRLTKDFEKKLAVFENLLTHKRLDSEELIRKAINNLLNIPTIGIYKSTALIKQAELARIENSTDMMNAVQESLTGTMPGRNAKSVLEEVKKEMQSMTVGLNRPAKNPGRIKVLQDQYQKLTSDYQEMKSAYEKTVEARKTGKKSNDELTEMNKKIEIIQKLIENHKLFDEANREVEEITRKIQKYEETISRVDQLFVKKENLTKKLDEFLEFKNNDTLSDADKIINLDAQIRAKRTMLQNLSSYKNVPDKYNYNLLMFISVLFIIASILGALVNPLLFLAVLVPIIILYTYKDSIKIKGTSNIVQLEQIKNTLSIDENKLQSVFKKYNVENKDAFYTRKLKFTSVNEEIKKIEAEIKGILGGVELKVIKQEQIVLMTRKREIETTKLTDEVKESKMTPQEYLAKRRELDDLNIRKRMLERQNIESEVRIEDTPVNYEDIVNIEEQIENTKQLQKQAEKELEVTRLVYEGLEGAINELSNDIESHVVRSIEKDLSAITDDRYQDAKIDNDFGIKVFSREKNDWVDPSSGLSSGTIDQIYFVYRLALLKIIEGDKSAPLLLDDPFVTYDQKRLEYAHKILERESEGRQILLFTHDDRYRNWGNTINV